MHRVNIILRGGSNTFWMPKGATNIFNEFFVYIPVILNAM